MDSIYKQGLNRKQQQFFPPSFDEYVSDDNPVRAIDEYVELLDLRSLGFTKASLASPDGQPAYHPRLLLKIYIYGYLNKIRSSRKLETEIKRNIEMMWLCAGLAPGYKTIANFRKENPKPLQKVFREFVLLLKELNLITGKTIAIDGAFLRANASKNQLIMKKTLQKDIQAIDTKIKEYLEMMTFEDAREKKEHIIKPLNKDKLSKMKERKCKLDKDLAMLEEMDVAQYNRTDPDARLMIKPAHNLMAYNTQIAVDSSYKFIVFTEVSSQAIDTQKLSTIAREVKKITEEEETVTLADGGYYSAKEIARCQKENIDIYVPVPKKQNKAKKSGYFTQDDFIYNEDKDCFICPNQQVLPKSLSYNIKPDGTKHYFYRASSKTCDACPLREKCIPQKTARKSISKSEYFKVVQEHRQKMQTDKARGLMKKRAALVEHPFGTIKQTLGWSHYLVRGKEKVSGENALIMFGYNFKRLLNLIGIALFGKLIKSLREGNIEAIRAEIEAYIACFRAIFEYFLGNMGLLRFRPVYSLGLA